MCGIVGCVSDEPVAGLLLNGLRRVEYRGYDSAGMATINGKGFEIRKGVGKVAQLAERLDFAEMEGSVGMGHCLHPDTYVQLADGSIKRIADMDDVEEVVSLDTGNLSLVVRRARKTSHPAPTHLVRIKTDSTELICTEAHRTIVMREGEMTEVPASQVLEDDLLILPKAIKVSGESRLLNRVGFKRYVRPSEEWTRALRSSIRAKGIRLAEASRRSGVSRSYMEHMVKGDRTLREDVAVRVARFWGLEVAKGLNPVSHSHSNYARFPSRTTPDLMQLIGYLFGDGHIHAKGVRIREEDEELVRRYQQLFSRLFSLNGRVVKTSWANAYELTVNSVALRRWLRVNFDFESHEFLARLGRLPDEEVAGFIRGLFDAEGAANTQSRQVAIRMTNKSVLRILRGLLLRFGVHSSLSAAKIRNPNWSQAYVLSMSGHENISNFLRKVSTYSGPKLRKILVIEQETNPGKSIREIPIPYTKENLRRFSGSQGVGRYLRRDEYLAPGSVAKLVGALSAGGRGLELVAELRRFSESDVYFERISSVTLVESGTDTVYDLEVEDTENFLANGIFTHNSRWATHGGVTDVNAHPHASCKEKVAVVHNGIIENYLQLKKQLVAGGHRFKSQTDTEVIAHLVEQEYGRTKDPTGAVLAATKKLNGQYAIVVIFQDRADTLVGARKDAPLIIGLGKGKNFIASDVLAFVEHTDRTIFLDNLEVVNITKEKVKIFGQDGKERRRQPTQVAWELSEASKLDYAHYTLKEINEQPKTVVSAGIQDKAKLEAFASAVKKAKSVFITAAGTSYHAGLLMSFRLKNEAGIRSEVILAGEFREHAAFVKRGSLVLAFSQSGETADVLSAVKEAKKRGARVMCIVNAAGSSLARESDLALLLNCGPEVGVAATKSFTAQVMVANLVVDALLGRKKADGMAELSRAVADALRAEDKIVKMASLYRDRPDFYFVAKGFHYPVALEGALKLKELSYIHAEGMPASELKHGTLALIEKGTPVVVINPTGDSHADTLSSAEELKARGADVIGVSDRKDEVYAHFVKVPRVQEKYMPVVESVPLQLLAYHLAIARKQDPDYPRNLAKSVTVK